MKQTAVELFEAHLIEYGFDLSLHKIEIDKFKEMEEEQHQETFEQSRLAKIFEKDMPPFWGSWERYYNEAFKSE
jgi:hypothetical protein